MRFAVVASRKDYAGINIVEALVKINKNILIFLVEQEIVYARKIDKLDADFIVFASKHQSEKGVKTLTVHPVGNWHKADFGGEDEKLCRCSAEMLKLFFVKLKENAEKYNLNFPVSMEITHHGPYIQKPCLFIEIGSNEENWKDKKAGEIIAKTISECISECINPAKKRKQSKFKCAIGIGGPHYCPNFNKIQAGSEFALAHIIPKYALPATKQMIQRAIDATIEKVECAVVDWKGLGSADDKSKTLKAVEECGLEVVRVK